MKELEKLVDDSTTYITVPTPEGWKCERPGCPTDFKHEHGTFGQLLYDAYQKVPKTGGPLFMSIKKTMAKSQPKDLAYHLTLFKLEGHSTWRAHLSQRKDGLDHERESQLQGVVPKITERQNIRIDRLTGAITTEDKV